MSYKFTKEELENLLIDNNQLAFQEFDMKLPEKCLIWDETLRDGEQSK